MPRFLKHACRVLGLALLAAAGLATAAWSDVGSAPPPTTLVPGAPTQVSEEVPLKETLVSLPLAAALGAALAFRPQRRGTPPRTPSVIQTQIILALVGALVMLVVGASLARAFGIVGAASLVRYRAKIEDPKDAGIMLSCLGIGLAAGVGIYWVAALATLFILAVVWALESLEPETRQAFVLKVKAKETADDLRPGIEDVLKRNDVKYELRTTSPDEMTYAVKLPPSKKTDRLTNALLALAKADGTSVEWSDQKPGKERKE
jgi:uncharacterized membrane protein YhiD involved in acid resistance